MEINISELLTETNNLSSTQSDIIGTLNNINNELNNVNNNIKSAELVEPINQLSSTISDISITLDRELSRLVDFMQSQLKSYQVTNEQATQELRSLVTSINDTFGGNSNSGQTSDILPNGKSRTELINEVIDGQWGNGDDRVQRLTAAGYNYDDIQNSVDAALGYGGATAAASTTVAAAGQTASGSTGDTGSTTSGSSGSGGNNSQPATSNSGTATNSGNFPTYNLTETQIRRIAALAVHEQGTAKGAAAEASLMANRFELYGSKYSSIESYVENSKWFANATRNMNDSKVVTQEAYEAVRKVLTEGKRTLPRYVDEHDCFSDLSSISTGSVKSRSSYVQNQTVIKNRYGSSYTFYSFPDSGSDPFGYTSEANRQKYGDECYNFEDI